MPSVASRTDWLVPGGGAGVVTCPDRLAALWLVLRHGRRWRSPMRRKQSPGPFWAWGYAGAMTPDFL